MHLTEPVRRLLAAALLVAPASAVSQELADLAARVDYGFHARDERVIDAARAALERMPEHDPAVRVHRAFAAFRAAQLASSAREAGERLDECTKLATPAAEAAQDAESWVLVAACGAVAVERGLAQARRRDQALARAAALDHDNPRLALIEAWTLDARAGAEPRERAAAAAKLAVAIERFRDVRVHDALNWGEAEALAQLGEIHMQRGETRLARDLIEKALLAAADYRFALELQNSLQRTAP
jgi:tetratricopeptide (TPR) repeat protein